MKKSLSVKLGIDCVLFFIVAMVQQKQYPCIVIRF